MLKPIIVVAAVIIAVTAAGCSSNGNSTPAATSTHTVSTWIEWGQVGLDRFSKCADVGDQACQDQVIADMQHLEIGLPAANYQPLSDLDRFRSSFAQWQQCEDQAGCNAYVYEVGFITKAGLVRQVFQAAADGKVG